jgi:hypothetical protein
LSGFVLYGMVGAGPPTSSRAKSKTPGVGGAGYNLSSYKTDYRETKNLEVNVTLRILPALKLPVSFATKARERCGLTGLEPAPRNWTG